nr:GNAT family N-acetyltransferase [uncultured Dyadobacter sp.]
MQPTDERPDPIFSHAEPVLSVADVALTVKYWHEVLGFPGQWTWGAPPNHGGVSWHNAFVQFSTDPEAAVRPKRQSVWMRVSHIQTLYRLHQERKAEIVMPLARQPYGYDEYMIRDINGYYISFAEPASAGHEKHSEPLPATVRVVGRKLTPTEYRHLANSVGWSGPTADERAQAVEELMQRKIDAAQFIAVAENSETGEAIGCALVLGDGLSFFYIKDVMVHPDWQRKRVGSAIMQEVKRWLDANAPDKSLVGLFAAESLAPFYQQTDFGKAFGMIRMIDRPGSK